MFKFLPRSSIKRIEPREFESNKYTSNSSKDCVLEVDLECGKQVLEIHNDYSLASDKMVSNYQLKTLIFTIFLLAMLKNWCLTFLNKSYKLHYENLQL